jgi:hypothetical protein
LHNKSNPADRYAPGDFFVKLITKLRRNFLITGTVTRQGVYEDKKDICELYISKESVDKLPHEHGRKKPIQIKIGSVLYEAGVHETKEGVVWISSVLYKKSTRREKVRLVDALALIGLAKGDAIKITQIDNGTFSIVP